MVSTALHSPAITDYLHIGDGRNVSARKHRHQGEHASNEERDSTWYRIQSQPEAEPAQHDHERRRRKSLNEMMACGRVSIMRFNVITFSLTDLSLKSEVNRQPRVVSVLLRHVAIGLLELQRSSQVVLQKLQLRIDVDAIFRPLQADLGIAVREALDVDWTNLYVHGIELEFHIIDIDNML